MNNQIHLHLSNHKQVCSLNNVTNITFLLECAGWLKFVRITFAGISFWFGACLVITIRGDGYLLLTTSVAKHPQLYSIWSSSDQATNHPVSGEEQTDTPLDTWSKTKRNTSTS